MAQGRDTACDVARHLRRILSISPLRFTTHIVSLSRARLKVGRVAARDAGISADAAVGAQVSAVFCSRAWPCVISYWAGGANVSRLALWTASHHFVLGRRCKRVCALRQAALISWTALELHSVAWPGVARVELATAPCAADAAVEDDDEVRKTRNGEGRRGRGRERFGGGGVRKEEDRGREGGGFSRRPSAHRGPTAGVGMTRRVRIISPLHEYAMTLDLHDITTRISLFFANTT